MLGQRTLSFEFSAPRDEEGRARLSRTLERLCRTQPAFMSVTYGAGGSTRANTVDLVARIQGEVGIESMAHLTCVGHSKAEIGEILSSLAASDIRNVLALGGDPPKGDGAFKPHLDGFAQEKINLPARLLVPAPPGVDEIGAAVTPVTFGTVASANA